MMKIATPDIIFRWPHEAHEENTTVAGLRTHSLSFADFRSNHPEGRLDRDASASVQRSRRTSPEASHLPGHHASSLALGGPAVGRSSIGTCRTAFVTNHSALSAFCGANTTRQSRTSPHDGRLPSTDGYPPISSARTSTALKPSGNRAPEEADKDGWNAIREAKRAALPMHHRSEPQRAFSSSRLARLRLALRSATRRYEANVHLVCPGVLELTVVACKSSLVHDGESAVDGIS